jgi:hypothetical protein
VLTRLCCVAIEVMRSVLEVLLPKTVSAKLTPMTIRRQIGQSQRPTRHKRDRSPPANLVGIEYKINLLSAASPHLNI